MREIKVSDQPGLGFSRTLRITVDGIRYRLFRSMVTVSVIAVAVAFLLNVLSESLIKRAVARDTHERIAQSRLVHEWAARLSSAGTIESILREAVDTAENITGLAALGGLSAEEAKQFSAHAGEACGYIDFFADLDYARRRRLVHQSEGIGIFDRLAADGQFETFMTALQNTASVRLQGNPDDFRAFMGNWPHIKAQTDRIREGQTAAVAKITAALGERDLAQAMLDADGSFGQTVRDAGFDLNQNTARMVADQAQQVLDMRLVEKALEGRATRQIVARHHDILPGDVTIMMLWRFVSNTDHGADFLSAMGSTDISAEGLTAERLSALAGHWKQQNQLERADRLTADISGGWLGLGKRTAWLLMVSMLVCGIGIANAMLMTVTERFREIATLKCLGALDGFIMIMFVLESCIMGIVGGIAGGILGAILGSARMLISFGTAFSRSVPYTELFASLGVAILVGVFLAVIAAVYPSFRAARLAPMEAMRVE